MPSAAPRIACIAASETPPSAEYGSNARRQRSLKARSASWRNSSSSGEPDGVAGRIAKTVENIVDGVINARVAVASS
ncbi:MAG: hypothetical protein L0J74_03760 [Corynebacterium sp.]|uniref:hypothetical protein n=1 Tax=Corynebacterium TaxID=1716 RepID=UPI0026479205|nr:hypothetical protein [Corynebacterium sp.]MDN5722786.1 hypothetical protein [Corynebacterium sp.]MDN6282314.1 hypothetical protein [Corynebacterium sp.]MDN6304911.1 hypothetical protein [Corynebacterium sp.]MDN6351761.1 hypothetical protein [Corynebacterium sp.]MDN6366731.1 hypothetical protein [Corynebacterium sp.]